MEVELNLSKWPRLLATTTPDGADWMTFNQHDVIIARSLMVINYTLLEAIRKSKFSAESDILIFLCLDILNYGALIDSLKV